MNGRGDSLGVLFERGRNKVTSNLVLNRRLVVKDVRGQVYPLCLRFCIKQLFEDSSLAQEDILHVERLPVGSLFLELALGRRGSRNHFRTVLLAHLQVVAKLAGGEPKLPFHGEVGGGSSVGGFLASGHVGS